MASVARYTFRVVGMAKSAESLAGNWPCVQARRGCCERAVMNHRCFAALGCLGQRSVSVLVACAFVFSAVMWYFSQLHVDVYVRHHVASRRNARVSVCDSTRSV